MDRSEIALKSVIDSCYTFLHALCVVIPSIKFTGFQTLYKAVQNRCMFYKYQVGVSNA